MLYWYRITGVVFYSILHYKKLCEQWRTNNKIIDNANVIYNENNL